MAFRLRWPTEINFITQRFGDRPEVYKAFGLPGHEGLDFRAPTGSKVFACADGVVVEIRQDCGNKMTCPYGNQVRIRHDTDEGEFTTIYAHLQGMSVAVGQSVSAGDLIGLADNTGNTEASHLHLTLKLKGATAAGLTGFPRDIVDPEPFLDPFPDEGAQPALQVDDLNFQADVTVPDGSLKQGGEEFVKTWLVRNQGTTTWGEGYKLAFFADEQMGAPDTVPLPEAAPGGSVEVSVTLTAPESAGQHRSTWKARNADGDLFGHILFALIKVPEDEQDQPANAVIDISHHNAVQDMQAIRDDGILGIIHKATQGVDFVDSKYAARRTEALGLGLLWGAYHFGDGTDPNAQVDHFLDTVQPDDETLLVLDFERNSLVPTNSMTLAQAEQFAARLRDQTGRLPVIYTGRWYIREFIGDHQSTSLSECPLWIASYLEVPSLPAQWPTWTFWQYTNGSFGPEPHKVAGLGRCDRDKFNGTADELRTLWTG